MFHAHFHLITVTGVIATSGVGSTIPPVDVNPRNMFFKGRINISLLHILKSIGTDLQVETTLAPFFIFIKSPLKRLRLKQCSNCFLLGSRQYPHLFLHLAKKANKNPKSLIDTFSTVVRNTCPGKLETNEPNNWLNKGKVWIRYASQLINLIETWTNVKCVG